MAQNAANPRAQGAELREVLFEFSAVGNTVRVCAVDPDSMIEATVLGPVSAGEQALKHAALQKLRYLLNKQNNVASTSISHRWA